MLELCKKIIFIYFSSSKLKYSTNLRLHKRIQRITNIYTCCLVSEHPEQQESFKLYFSFRKFSIQRRWNPPLETYAIEDIEDILP